MTRSQLIIRLASRFPGLMVPDASLSVNAILEAISTVLMQGERAEIRGFGTFSVNRRPPRRGRNPKTGAMVQVPAKAVPHFKPGNELRDRVNVQVSSAHIPKASDNIFTDLEFAPEEASV
jgi:integration host factor subunit beta